MTNYFFDIEYIEYSGRRFDIISIGVVSEDYKKYYAVQTAAMYLWPDIYRIDPTVADTVFVHLEHPEKNMGLYKCYGTIASEITEFVGRGPARFWCFDAPYQWVLFCNMFSHKSLLPSSIVPMPFDLKLWHVWAGEPALPEIPRRHHAMDEALWNYAVYSLLMERTGSPEGVFNATSV